MDPTSEIRGFKAAKICPEMIAELKEKARKGRVWSVIATSAAKSGHPGGALSSMDIYMTLLAVADISPDRSDCIERDRIVISHGHTSAGFYSALAANGFFPPEEMYPNFRRTCSPFQGHVERDVPGVDWGTGNLGQGLAAGVGFALAARARGSNAKTWVVMGDGEQVKGQVSEARRIAAKEKLNNLTVLVDWNDIQISGHIEEVMPVNIPGIWKADGWHVIECDGHSYSQIYDAMRCAVTHEGCYVILCRTVMGKGVSFMQNIPDYHGKAASGDDLATALRELGSDMEIYEKALETRKGELPKGREVIRCVPDIDTGTPVTYTKEDKKDNRGAFGKALAQVGELNYKKEGRTPIIVFDCDLAGSVKVDGFAKACPDNFIQSGIQEHATATVAGAASAAGAVSLWAAFGVFGADEVYNQQRLNDINKASIKTVLTHTGLDVGEDGMTHQCIDYVGLFRNTFGWKVIVPADPNQTDRATRWMLKEPGNVCLAMGRSVLPVVLKEDGTPYYGDGYSFSYGDIDVLREGKDAVILSMGHFAGRAIAARDLLAAEGISVKVLHCASPLAMDAQKLFELVGDKPFVTCEDHHVNTGIGSIAAMMFARAGKAVRILNMGVTHYGCSGPGNEVMAEMKLSPEDIAAAVKGSLNQMIKAGDLVFIWNPKKGDNFLIKVTPGMSQGTHFGQIKHTELMEHGYGEGIITPKGEIYYLLRPTLAGYTRRIKRQTQIVFPKDAGFILQHMNIFPGCTVVECGTGSGSLCCTFAHFVGDDGKVCTYDRREEFSALAKKNAEKWGVAHRIEFNVRSLDDGFKERNADAVFLDIPTPWEYIDKAYEALAPGNHLGILVPTANQISETLVKLSEFGFADVQVVELMLRYYKTEPNRIRPEDVMIGHTGYLIFAVKTLPLPEQVPLAEDNGDAETEAEAEEDVTEE